MAVLNKSLIESASSGNTLDRRNLDLAVYATLQQLLQANGQNFPESANGQQAPSSPPPVQGSLAVTGANGQFTIEITPGTQGVNSTVYYEVSYSTNQTFTTAVMVLPVSTSTHFTLPSPGTTVYWRMRSSFDQKNWSGYSYASAGAAVDSGLQSSAATSPAVPLNITNYANIDSVAAGGSANIRIYGSGGPNTQWIGVKGGKETIFPSATIIGAPYNSEQYSGYDGEQYLVKKTLPEVFPDHVTPVGKVSIVGSGAVVLPTVALVIDGAGRVIAWNVLTQGNGLTGPVTLVINTTTGTGATSGAQTITGGKLISISPGNPGLNYGGGDTVAVSGGVFSGAPGGGTITGSNGGRLTAV